jgi:hypothetical protein
VNAAAHLAEAERLVGLAHRLPLNYRDDDGRVTRADEDATPLAAMATAHASIAAAMEAQQTRKARGGI